MSTKLTNNKIQNINELPYNRRIKIITLRCYSKFLNKKKIEKKPTVTRTYVLNEIKRYVQDHNLYSKPNTYIMILANEWEILVYNLTSSVPTINYSLSHIIMDLTLKNKLYNYVIIRVNVNDVYKNYDFKSMLLEQISAYILWKDSFNKKNDCILYIVALVPFLELSDMEINENSPEI